MKVNYISGCRIFAHEPPWNKAKCHRSIFCVRVSFRSLARLTINYKHKFRAVISQVQKSSTMALKYSLFIHESAYHVTLAGFSLIGRCVKRRVSCSIWHYLIHFINAGFCSLIYFMCLSWIVIKRKGELSESLWDKLPCPHNLAAKQFSRFLKEQNSSSIK